MDALGLAVLESELRHDVRVWRLAFLPEEVKRPLNESRGFRNIFVHAYELESEESRIRALLDDAQAVVETLDVLITRFFDRVRRELEPPLPPSGGE